jgi:anthranilate phosphoribosyltransferase
MKGERPAELVGLARTMRARGVAIDAGPDAVDTCGTGGDRSGTFNISTAAAIVVAGTGQPVVKHGNRSVSSHCGSADVLEALGVTVSAPPAVVQRAVREVGLAFCFAPTFHPAMRHAVETRKALGVPTAFNLLGPLTNPARVSFQIVGVARPELTELMARALQQLGARRAWVVHGADGLDELSTTGYTKVSECHGAVVRTFYVHPADVGLAKATPQSLQGASAADNAAIIRRVLAGEAGAARDVVLLNAGAALFVAGRAASLREGLALAASSIDGGAAARTLAALCGITGAPA